MTPEKVNNKKQAVFLSNKWKLCDDDAAVRDEPCLPHSSGVRGLCSWCTSCAVWYRASLEAEEALQKLAACLLGVRSWDCLKALIRCTRLAGSTTLECRL